MHIRYVFQANDETWEACMERQMMKLEEWGYLESDDAMYDADAEMYVIFRSSFKEYS